MTGTLAFSRLVLYDKPYSFHTDLIMLTRAQHKTFEFIKQYMQLNPYAPTVEEVARGIGIQSKGVAYRYIKALAQAGLIRLIPNRQRNILLGSSQGCETGLSIPILGRIAAGQPIEALVEPESLDVLGLFQGQHCYALRVKGESMIDEGIWPNDIVICEPCQTAENQQIVVALIDDQDATLKRFKKNADGSITLIPANAALSPITLAGHRVKIQGRLIGLLRLGQNSTL
jgi:repressor LexA